MRSTLHATIILALVSFHAAALFAQQNITYVQGNSAVPQAPQTTVTVPFSAAQTAGDLNVVVVGWNDSTANVSSITDTRGNTYRLAVGPTIQSGVASQSIYYASNIAAATAGANVVTVVFSTAAPFPDIRILEYKGADPNNPVDVTAASSGNSGTSSSGSATTTNAADLIFGANLVQSTTTGPGTGFTSRLLTGDGDIAEDQMVTAAGSYSAAAPISPEQWIMQMVAFRSAAAVPSGTICSSFEVQSAINSALGGSTVQLTSPCNTTWSTAVDIPNTKGITLDGNGATINGSITVETNSITSTRITNFTFTKSGNNTNAGAALYITGTSLTNARWRVDHCTFTGSGSDTVDFGFSPGVFDHNSMTGGDASDEQIHILGFQPGNNTGWTTPMPSVGSRASGTDEAIFFENNTFSASSYSSSNPSWIESFYGSRVVYRYNQFNYFRTDAHGNNQNVGARWWEFYNNDYHQTSAGNAGGFSINLRAGSGIIFNNTYSGNINPQSNIGMCQENAVLNQTYPGTDQIGRGTNQVLDPAYTWNNNQSVQVDTCEALSTPGFVAFNRDVYTDVDSASCTAGGSCTSGVGIGTTLPTSCTTGVAFWNTNAGGHWNKTTSNTNDGALYKCIATNTWTLYYTPYTYPHPLTSSTITLLTPGNSGTIIASSVTSSSLSLTWTKALDPVYAQNTLQYEVCQSPSNNIFTVANCETNGTIIQPYTADIASFNVTGLASGNTYFFNVVVKNQAGNKTGYTMTGATTSGLLLSPGTLPAGAVGFAYSQSITASGGTGPYTFSIVNGALPAGLTLNTSTGALSGTPSSAGTVNFTIQAVDSLSKQGQQPYSLGIAGDYTNNIVLVLNSVSYNSAPSPGFVGTYTINVSIRNFGPVLGNPIFLKITQLSKLVPDLNPAQPDMLLTADNGAGVAGDVQSLSLTGLASGGASTDVSFQIGLGSRQQFNFIADLYGLLSGSSLTAAEEIGKVKADGTSETGARLLKRFTFQAQEPISPVVSADSDGSSHGGDPDKSSAIPPASNVDLITGQGSRSRSAAAVDPILPRRMAVAANDTGGNVIVSTTEDGGRTWRPTMMSRSLGDRNFFNAQDASLAFDSLGRLSVVYVLSNMNDAANAIVIAESTDGVHFNPPYAISLHTAGENVIDSRPVIAIGPGSRYVAWENFGSGINVVRSDPGGIFGPPVTVVSGARVSSPAIAIGEKAVYIGWDEWGFNSHPPYSTGGRLMMASSPHGARLRFSDPGEIATTNIGFASPRIPMLPAPRGVSTNLNLVVSPPKGKNLLYAAFVDNRDGIHVRFSQSFDDGKTWNATTLQNSAGGGDQFSPAMTLDSDGNVYISFYDTLKKGAATAQVFLATQSQPTFGQCEVRPSGAESALNFRIRGNCSDTPQISSFTYRQITTVPIDESRKNLGSQIVTNLGDRTGLAVSSEGTLITWTDTRERKEDIYLSILPVLHGEKVR